jgi:hypothetical protein
LFTAASAWIKMLIFETPHTWQTKPTLRPESYPYSSHHVP